MDETQRNEVEESGRRKCRSKQKEIHRNKRDWVGEDEGRKERNTEEDKE
jgi:hypothetical protein